MKSTFRKTLHILGIRGFFFRFHFDSSPKNIEKFEAFFPEPFFQNQAQTLKLLGVSKSEAISEAVRC